jgi:hypothetical protein
MLLEELIHLVIILKLSTALLKILDPVETSILKLWQETLLYLSTLDISYKHTRSIKSIDILL